VNAITNRAFRYTTDWLHRRFTLAPRWDPMPEFDKCPACKGACYMRSVMDGAGYQYKIPRWKGDRHKGLFPCPTCKAKGKIAIPGSDNDILRRMDRA